ncbi:MAG: hypothetical protein A4S09_10430 [Proteobacteria bacterium SG_bin7]|nr:MAG: hypothetical protein A4S09_10430 [Proteobacteria bacterium SG_bin7]
MGCQPREKREADPILEAYRLIDEQRTDEAIALLENELRKNDSNIELRVVLASAYAHKGGIKIQKLFPVVNSIDKINKSKEKLGDVSKQKNINEKTNTVLLNAANLMIRASRFLDAYAAIPAADRKQVEYIRHAILLLSEISNTALKPEDVLFRAILEIVLLKHILAENFIGELSATDDPKKCDLDIAKINSNIVVTGKLLIDIFNDIGFVKSTSATDMKHLTEETIDVVESLKSLFSAAEALDEVGKTFLNESIIQSGFGKMLKCGGN